jgi:hypothetical protein
MDFEKWDALLAAVSPVTREVLLAWLMSPWLLVEHLEGCEPAVQATIIEELQGQGMLEWHDGVPSLSEGDEP